MSAGVIPSVIDSRFGSLIGPVPTTGPWIARSAGRVYEDVPPVLAHRPSTVIVISAVPVQAAGSARPVPGSIRGGVVDVDGGLGGSDPDSPAADLDGRGEPPTDVARLSPEWPDSDGTAESLAG